MKREKEQIDDKSGFSDPIKINEEREIRKPIDGKKSPWDFRSPEYDQRSSSFINAGTHYGSGRKQPVGHEGNPKREVAALPCDRRKVKTMRDDDEG